MNTACPRRVSLIIAGGLPAIPSPTICVWSGVRPDASGSFPPRQASSLASRLAHSRRPNRVHGGCPPGQPVLRTGRSRSVALHPASLRRSYGSIPHDSSPHRSGLPPLHLPAFSGALAGRIDLPAPTPPDMRVRIRRFQSDPKDETALFLCRADSFQFAFKMGLTRLSH
jgi:hypothetical protein